MTDKEFDQLVTIALMLPGVCSTDLGTIAVHYSGGGRPAFHLLDCMGDDGYVWVSEVQAARDHSKKFWVPAKDMSFARARRIVSENYKRHHQQP